MKLWAEQKSLHQRTTSLVNSLGKPSVTAPQAKRLDVLGLSYSALLSLRLESKKEEDLIATLKAKGVNSKPLREKLTKLLKVQGVAIPEDSLVVPESAHSISSSLLQ